MAFASPYAVFRAVDVIWPPRPPQPLPVVLAPVNRPCKRRRPIAVQGELFPVLQSAP